MPRIDDIPKCPPPPPVTRGGPGWTDLIELVTPLFGGGVEAGENDLSMPIRATAIRGQLQFWWRATCGRLLLTPAELWRRQEEVFGSAEFPSPLEVVVSGVNGVREVDPGQVFDRFGPESYALFPAVENGNRLLAEGLKFQLELRWPDVEHLRLLRKAQNERLRQAGKPLLPAEIRDVAADVEAAVWAWLTLGGLGARTRRGAGAVHCRRLTVPAAGKPGLAARVFVGSAQKHAVAAWIHAVGVYRDFRQTPRGRMHRKTISTRGGSRTITVPGRSHWPEADSIRSITGCSLRPAAGTAPSGVPADEDPHDHSTPVVPANLLPAFPKAALGLPINFHFADAPGKNQPGHANRDPQDVQLVPLLPQPGGRCVPGERLASPVLTRPLHINGRWHPAVIIFDAPWLGALEARLVGGRSMAGGGAVSADISANRIVNGALGGLEPMRGQPSALQALACYLSGEVGFTEQTQ
jgi:CRISPR-associated protein Cmr1